MNRKIILAIAVVVVAVLLWQSPAIISMFKSATSDYTKVTLVVSQPNTVQFGNNAYILRYDGSVMNIVTGKQEYVFYVNPSGTIEVKTYDAVEDSVYRDLGLEMKVGEVHNEYMILYVKSTVL